MMSRKSGPADLGLEEPVHAVHWTTAAASAPGVDEKAVKRAWRPPSRFWHRERFMSQCVTALII
jgi:hypothetical protein